MAEIEFTYKKPNSEIYRNYVDLLRRAEAINQMIRDMDEKYHVGEYMDYLYHKSLEETE